MRREISTLLNLLKCIYAGDGCAGGALGIYIRVLILSPQVIYAGGEGGDAWKRVRWPRFLLLLRQIWCQELVYFSQRGFAIDSVSSF
jgi:hypothetical protein